MTVQLVLIRHPGAQRGRTGHGFGGLRQHRLHRRSEHHPRASLTACPSSRVGPAGSTRPGGTAMNHPSEGPGGAGADCGTVAACAGWSPAPAPRRAAHGLRMRHRPPRPPGSLLATVQKSARGPAAQDSHTRGLRYGWRSVRHTCHGEPIGIPPPGRNTHAAPPPPRTAVGRFPAQMDDARRWQRRA